MPITPHPKLPSYWTGPTAQNLGRQDAPSDQKKGQEQRGDDDEGEGDASIEQRSPQDHAHRQCDRPERDSQLGGGRRTPPLTTDQPADSQRDQEWRGDFQRSAERRSFVVRAAS